MRKRSTIILICFILSLVFIMAACTKGVETKEPTDTKTSEKVEATQEKAGEEMQEKEDPYSLPLVEPGSVTLKYLVAENSSGLPSRSSGLPVILKIQELTGINLDIETAAGSEYETVVTTRLAANVDLPDILRMSGSHYEYGLEGVLVNLTPYIEKYDTYLEEYFSYEPGSKGYFVSPDGNYYGWYPVKSGTDLADPYGWIIRQDWLDRLGLDTPTTVDEWYEVLTAFKENDANGNGDPNDEIPWCNPGLECQTIWGNAWGLMMYRNEGWQINEEGKVELDWIKPEAKEMFEWLNKCYSEGLLDYEFMTMDHKARFSQNVVGAYSRYANTTESRAVLAREGGDPEAFYRGVAAPIGPHGDQAYIGSYGPADTIGGNAITNNCENPDAAFLFCDWVWGSPEGMTLLWFGIEGEHYELNSEGKPTYGDFFLNNPDGYNTTTALQVIGGHEIFSSIRSIEGPWGVWAEAQLSSVKENISESAKTMSPYIVNKFPVLPTTPDEADEIAMYWNDISTYYEEHAVGFITGDISLDKWDEYVEVIKSLNLDRIIELKQAQYDRMMGN